MNIVDIKDQINGYIRNCGEDPSDWYVEAMADFIHSDPEFDGIDDLDGIAENRFAEILQEYAK